MIKCLVEWNYSEGDYSNRISFALIREQLKLLQQQSLQLITLMIMIKNAKLEFSIDKDVLNIITVEHRLSETIRMYL